MDIKALANKRVGKVPVLYIAGAVAVALAVLAYRMKSTADITAGTDNPGDPAVDSAPMDSVEGAGDAGVVAGDVYPQLPTGTVISSPTAGASGEGTNSAIETNEEWLKAAGSWLAANKGVSPGTAQALLTKYLDGSTLSYSEGLLRDAAISHYGYPPDLTPSPVTETKPAAPAAAKVQGPLPRTHIVKGTSDDSLTELANLYYPTHGGASQAVGDMIQAANPQLPSAGPYKVGTGVHLPVYTPPKYLVATKSVNTLAQFAAKSGKSQEQIRRLNDGAVLVHFPAAIGTRVRVG